MKTTHAFPVKALLVGLVIVGVCLPLSSRASTTDDLASQIAALRAQVVQLQARLGASASSKPAVTFVVQKKVATFDQRSYTSTSHNPEVSGSANVPSVYLIIRNDRFEGIVGTGAEVQNGAWTYKSVVALPSGYYTVELYGGEIVTTRTLHVL